MGGNFKNSEFVVKSFISHREKYNFFINDKEYTNYCKKTIAIILNGMIYKDENFGIGVL